MKEWLKVWEGLSKEGIAQKVLDGGGSLPWEAEDAYRTRSGFMNLLQKRHSYSPAAADEFAEALREMAQDFSPRLRGSGQVVYIGVSTTEGSGRSLREARLQAVVLDYVTPEDWAKAERTSPRGLKWSRIERFASQAYAQGAALTLHDIAYLVSASVDAARHAVSEHSQVKYVHPDYQFAMAKIRRLALAYPPKKGKGKEGREPNC